MARGCDANLTNESGHTLLLDGATIESDFFARQQFSSVGEVRAIGLNVSGRLELDGARLVNKGNNALNLESASIEQCLKSVDLLGKGRTFPSLEISPECECSRDVSR